MKYQVIFYTTQSIHTPSLFYYSKLFNTWIEASNFTVDIEKMTIEERNTLFDPFFSCFITNYSFFIKRYID